MRHLAIFLLGIIGLCSITFIAWLAGLVINFFTGVNILVGILTVPQWLEVICLIYILGWGLAICMDIHWNFLE